MRSKSLSLFEQHQIDLRRISPNASDVFVCPICFRVVRRENVNQDTINLGHVWPAFLRNELDEDHAKHQQVLLCKSCNSSAGSRGDSEMQKHEMARRGLLPNKVWINPLGESPFYVDLFVEFSEEKSTGKITVKVPQGEWQYNERWLKLRAIADGRSKIDIVINQFVANWKLAQVGWLTSAYLFAFYTFGYRYVFQRILDPVREYIQQSFHGTVDERLKFNDKKEVCVQTCKIHNYQEPQIIYHMKTQSSLVPHHLEISLLDYHVRLPIPLKDYEEIPINSLPDPEMVLAADATGHMPHDKECIWEQLMNEPDYEVTGSALRGA